MKKEIPIANPGECEFFEDNDHVREGPLWLLHFGAYGETALYVWSDGCESAFEVAVEWLDDNAPGHLVKFEESDYRAAAAELGLSWEPDEQANAETDRIIEHAEVDHTVIGHTTLEHGTHVASWEWTLREVEHDSEEWQSVVARSLELEAAEAS
jgi:hypothetical protein